jgi:hypothetical protein
MSDPDDSVIEQLQARRSRPRRQPPARRTTRSAPTDPASQMDNRETDTASAEPTLNQAAVASAQPEPFVSPAPTDTATPPATTPGTEHAAGHQTTKPAGAETTAPAKQPIPGRLRLGADEPTANYAVRVRRSLDDLVAWRLAQLRRHGTRASKVELTEMLLWELENVDVDDLVTRLEYFRRHAPRQ